MTLHPTLTFRPAIPEDASFIAEVVAVALGADLWDNENAAKQPDAALIEVCRRTDTLYSWQNTVIAEVEGARAGGIVAYDGADYHDMRLRTFDALRHLLTFDPEQMVDEAQRGEYYIDSVAVKPQHRGCGIAGRLLNTAVEEAHRRDLTTLLACDPQNILAKKLYERLGFAETGRYFIFGHEYLRMTHD